MVACTAGGTGVGSLSSCPGSEMDTEAIAADNGLSVAGESDEESRIVMKET